MRNIDFKELNCDFSPSPQTALSVTFVAHDQNPKSCFLFDAKSPENVAFFVRGHTPDALWGIGAFSAILSEASVAPASAAPGQDFPAQCRLCTSRFVVGVDLRSGSRSASDQQDRTASVQRCVSGFVGIGPFSKPNNLAPVASAAVASKHSAIGGSARSAACSVPGSAHSALQSDPGPGLCGADALRPPARSPSRLQPQKEGASLVSSSTLLRSLPPGVLAWLVATRQHVGQYRSGFLSSSLPGQSAFHDSSLAHPREGRCGIFRRQVFGPAGAAGIELRNCSQKLPHAQNPCSRSPIPQFAKRIGRRRISIPGVRLAEGSTVCGHAQTDTRGPHRSQTTDTVQRSPLRLQRDGDQFDLGPLAPLALLSTASHGRKEHPRTALRSASGQGSFGSLVGQRSFFSHRVVCLRSGALVQAVVSAHPLQNSDRRNGAERFLRFASTFGKSGRTKCAPTPKRLRPSRSLLVRISQSERSANFKKNVIL